MEVQCAQCGKTIRRKPSQIEKTQHSFCSKECRSLFQKSGWMLSCDWCGTAFYKPLSRIRNENFCSAACRNRWLGKQNVEVRNVPGHSAGHKAPHLTDLNRRRNPLGRLTGGKTKAVASQTYRKIAEEMIGRKLTKDEVVHHINGDRSDNRPENMAVLPRTEHNRLHMHLAVRKLERLENEGGDALCQKKKPAPEE